jgi:hypothetical protein
VQNILLLRRVFSIYEDAWQARIRSEPSDFMRMNATLSTWRLYVEECRTLRQIERNSTVARVFYEASLYARVFHAWVGVFNRILKGRIIAHNQYMAKRRAVCGRVFAAWSRYAFTKRLREYRYIRDAHDRRVAQMLQKVILAWRNQTLNSRHREFLVEQLVSTNLQRQFFSQWVYEHFVLKLFCVTRAKHNLYEYKKSVRTVFVRWRLALLGRMRIKAGAARMKQAVERFQLRAAFAKWPGRQSFALSEELRARLLRKGRGKARLVQCTLGRNCKPVECSDSESDNDHMDALSSVHDMMLKHKLGHGFSRRHRRRDNKGKATKSAGSKKLRHGVDGTTTEESSPNSSRVEDPDDENCATFIDFDAQNRKPLHERVLNICTDQEDLLHMYSLMRAIMSEWHRAVQRSFELRKLARQCAWLNGKRLLSRIIREWVRTKLYTVVS